MSNRDDRVRNVYAPPTKPGSAHNPGPRDPATLAELAQLQPAAVLAELDRRKALEQLNAYLQGAHIGFRCMLAAAGERGRRRALAAIDREEARQLALVDTEFDAQAIRKLATARRKEVRGSQV